MTQDFLIGSDPEAVLFVDGSRVTGQDYFTGISVGSDSAQVPIEFRPDPSESVEEHMENMRGCIQELMDTICKIQDFLGSSIRLRGGGAPTGHPIGGHIHISADSEIDEKARSLGAVLFSFNWMTGGEDFIDRLKVGKYGGPFDFRVKHHGFETRTPYSWLSSPIWTGAYLSIAWIMIRNWDKVKGDKRIGRLIDIYERNTLFRNERNDRGNRRWSGNNKAVYTDVYNIINEIFNWFTTLDGYSEVGRYLHFASNVTRRRTAMDTTRNIFVSWGIKPKSNTVNIYMGKESGLDIDVTSIKKKGIGDIYIYGSGRKHGRDLWVWSDEDSGPICKDVITYLKRKGYTVKHGRWGRYEKLSPSIGVVVGIPIHIRKEKGAINTIVNDISDIMSSHSDKYLPVMWW